MNVKMPVNTGNLKPREIHDKAGNLQVMAYGTPNSMATMYMLNSRLVGNRILQIKSLEQGKDFSPNLGGWLMETYPGISRLSFGSNAEGYDYVTVTVRAPGEWAKDNMRANLEQSLIGVAAHMSKYTLPQLFALEKMPQARSLHEYFHGYANAGCTKWEAQHRAVIALANNKLAHDGGEVHFAGYDDASQTMKVWLDGNCSDCKSSSMTVETNILNYFKMNPGKFERHVEKMQVVQQQPPIVTPVFA